MRTKWRSRLAALVLAGLVSAVAGAGHAADVPEGPADPGVTGIARLIKYSACAAGIAGGLVTGNKIQLVSAWLFCAQLFHEEKS